MLLPPDLKLAFEAGDPLVLGLLGLAFLAVLLVGSELRADWRFDGTYYWQGTQAYLVTRVRDGNCGCYRWNYQKVYPPQHQQSFVTTNSDNSITVHNTYQISQPAAAGGSSLYAYAGAAYSDLDLGGLLAHYGRIAEQGQSGALQVAQSLGALVNGATALEAEKAKVLQILATGEAASKLAAAVQPPPGPAQQIQAQIIESNAGTQPAGGGGLLGPLATQHCAGCHTAGGGTTDAKAIAKLDLDQPLTDRDAKRAIHSMLLDDEALRMPLNHPLDANTLGLLLQELSR